MDGTYWFKNSWRVSINSKYITTTEIGFELHHPLFDATILKQGAQLIHFQPKGSDPLLWSAELSTFEKGKAFRGGIPLCWPWFGKVGSPSHGFARIVEWSMVSHVESEESIQLVFELSDSEMTRALWPYTFTAQLEMNLGRDVALSLHIDAAKESSGALHTYFECNNVNDTTVTGLGSQYNDSLQNGKSCVSTVDALQVSYAVDRIYTQPETQTILKENEHSVSISHKNHSDVVVWNPWKEGTEKLSDMNEDDYAHMLCVESARITKPFQSKDSLHLKIHLETLH